MRKLRAFMALAFAALLAIPASAQVKFGLKGGLDVTHMSLNSEVFDKSNRAGFYFGPTMKFTIPLVGLGVDVSALYDQRTAEVSMDYGNEQIVSDHEESLTQRQIAIPINLRYAVGLGSTANVFFFAGPQFGFNVGSDKDEINFKWKDSNFSVNLGVGFTMLSHLQLNLNYNIACGKTGEVKPTSVLPDVASNIHARYNAWQLGLAYFF